MVKTDDWRYTRRAWIIRFCYYKQNPDCAKKLLVSWTAKGILSQSLEMKSELTCLLCVMWQSISVCQMLECETGKTKKKKKLEGQKNRHSWIYMLQFKQNCIHWKSQTATRKVQIKDEVCEPRFTETEFSKFFKSIFSWCGKLSKILTHRAELITVEQPTDGQLWISRGKRVCPFHLRHNTPPWGCLCTEYVSKHLFV